MLPAMFQKDAISQITPQACAPLEQRVLSKGELIILYSIADLFIEEEMHIDMYTQLDMFYNFTITSHTMLLITLVAIGI